MTRRNRNLLTFAVVAMAAFAMTTAANAAPITGSSYSADVDPGGAPWGDAGGDPTAMSGVAWAASELFDTTIATGDATNVVAWWRNATEGPTLTFDLGSLYDVQTIDVWRTWRPQETTALTDLKFSVSTDGVTYSTPVAYTPATWTSNQAIIDVSAFDNARYVKMKLDGGDNGWKMVTEVEFDGTPAANAAAIIGSSYSADIYPGDQVWGDAGGDPTAAGGVAWADSELFDGTIATGDATNVVGWWENAGAGPTLTFDLGALYDVQTIDVARVWRPQESTGLTDLELSVSTDGVTYSTPVVYTPATWTSNQAIIDVSAFDNARYVKMKLDGGDNGWKMLSEVEFYGSTVIPEPSTFVLAALGLLGLGWYGRRRRKRAA